MRLPSYRALDRLISSPCLLLALLVSVGSTVEASAKPARVILIHHSEKTEDEKDIHLSERGAKRAEALVGFFAAKFGIDTNHPPILFATRRTRPTLSLRPRETLQPQGEVNMAPTTVRTFRQLLLLVSGPEEPYKLSNAKETNA